MKIFITLPISASSTERCRQRAERIKAVIKTKGHEAVTPFDICPSLPTVGGYLAKSIETLLGCDGLMRCAGWSLSKCCSAESATAQIFKKEIFDHVNQIKPIKQ